MLKDMKDDKGCYKKPVQAKMLSQHRHHLKRHSLVVLFHLKVQGYDLKQESHMPEIYPKKLYLEYMTEGVEKIFHSLKEHGEFMN